MEEAGQVLLDIGLAGFVREVRLPTEVAALAAAWVMLVGGSCATIGTL